MLTDLILNKGADGKEIIVNCQKEIDKGISVCTGGAPSRMRVRIYQKDCDGRKAVGGKIPRAHGPEADIASTGSLCLQIS